MFVENKRVQVLIPRNTTIPSSLCSSDSIVFLKAENGVLCVGVQRAKKETILRNLMVKASTLMAGMMTQCDDTLPVLSLRLAGSARRPAPPATSKLR
ncbi:unnamed protein product [Lactuca virosa]|uniref:Uncharacterized protein n=1 Tax=Lactuca virosa TaxID=75947 RepID=A0AAU9MB68_9ASTR|nr:unnamed protein product [Lactuca virosa]